MNDILKRLEMLEFHTKLLADACECKMTAFFVNNELDENAVDAIHDIFDRVNKVLVKNKSPERLLFEDEINAILKGKGTVEELVMCMGISERWILVCRWYRGF